MKYELKTCDTDFCSSLMRPLCAGDSESYEISYKVDKPSFVKVSAKRADGRIITVTGEETDGVCSCTLSPDMYSVPGELILRVYIVSGRECLTVREIKCNVLEEL